jgi:hypothetical protein
MFSCTTEAPAAAPPPPHPDNQYNKVAFHSSALVFANRTQSRSIISQISQVMTDMFKQFVRQQQKLDAASPWATASPAFVNIQSICPHLNLKYRSSICKRLLS